MTPGPLIEAFRLLSRPDVLSLFLRIRERPSPFNELLASADMAKGIRVPPPRAAPRRGPDRSGKSAKGSGLPGHGEG